MPTNFAQPKDPDDIDDLVWDWSLRLTTGETISTFTATAVNNSCTVVSTSNTATTGTARISGGTEGSPASARGRIVTSTGRQLDWTLVVMIQGQ
jgi:hypothetical protein